MLKFSHSCLQIAGCPIFTFSVKEFLMSDQLATLRRDISQYHISLEDTHLFLTRASLAIPLCNPDANTHSNSAPLAKYAAEHWVTHSQVKNEAHDEAETIC